MAGRFLGLLGLLGAKYMMDDDAEHVVNQKDLADVEREQEAKYKLSPARIHKRIRDSETEEEKKLRLRIEALSKK